MGCDIHLYVEVRKAEGSPWVFVHPPLGHDAYAEQNGHPAQWAPWRDYLAFGILAGVRRRAEPIAGPRGVPHDRTDTYADAVEEWCGDGHTHSWLMLDELEAYPWDDLPRKLELRTHLLPALRALKQDGGVHAVRVVFFFDN